MVKTKVVRLKTWLWETITERSLAHFGHPGEEQTYLALLLEGNPSKPALKTVAAPAEIKKIDRKKEKEKEESNKALEEMNASILYYYKGEWRQEPECLIAVDRKADQMRAYYTNVPEIDVDFMIQAMSCTYAKINCNDISPMVRAMSKTQSEEFVKLYDRMVKEQRRKV